MFYKGILQSYDHEDEVGKILLVDVNEEINFSIRDLPNSSIEPRIGERLKCIVEKSNDFSWAKLIVRIDRKNAKPVIENITETHDNSQFVSAEYQAILNVKLEAEKRLLTEDLVPEIKESDTTFVDSANEFADHSKRLFLASQIHPFCDCENIEKNKTLSNENKMFWFKRLLLPLNYNVYKPVDKKNTKIKEKKVKRPGQPAYIVPVSLIIIILVSLVMHFGNMAYTQYEMHNLNQELKLQEYLKQQEIIIEEQRRKALK